MRRVVTAQEEGVSEGCTALRRRERGGVEGNSGGAGAGGESTASAL
jgi:hypothetical protein